LPSHPDTKQTPVSDTRQDHTYLTEAVEAFRKEFFDVTGDRLNGTVVRRALRAAEPFFASHYEQKGAEGERKRVTEALRAKRKRHEARTNEVDAPTLRDWNEGAAAACRDFAAALEEEADPPVGDEERRLAAFRALTEGNFFSFTDPEGQEEYVWRYVDAVLDAYFALSEKETDQPGGTDGD
jgi:hypothetical protein